MTAPTRIVEGFSLSHAAIMNGTETWEEALWRLYDESLDVYGVSDSSLEPSTDSFDNEGDDTVLSRWEWLNYATLSITAGYISFPLISNLTNRPAEISGATAEVQTITVTGTPTGGSFTLTFSGSTTGAIPYNATAAQVKTALEALPNISSGDITTAGGPLPGTPVTVTFASGDVAVMTATGSFTGGSTPAAAITTTTPGGDPDDLIVGVDLWHEDTFNVDARPMILQMPSKDNRGKARLLSIGLYRVQFAPFTFDGPRYKDGLKINYSGTALMSAFDEKGDVFPDGKKRIGRLLSSSVVAPA